MHKSDGPAPLRLGMQPGDLFILRNAGNIIPPHGAGNGGEAATIEFALTATIQENVLVQLTNLRTIPAVATRLMRGDLHLHGWVYKIETGEVFAFDVQKFQFVKLADYDPKMSLDTRRRTSHQI